MIANCFGCGKEIEIQVLNGEEPPAILCTPCLDKGWEIIEDEDIIPQYTEYTVH